MHKIENIFVAPFLLFLCALSVQAQVQDRPKAGPEQKKLEAFAGDWTYTGVLHDTPLGPGGKFSGKESSKLVLDGLFLQSTEEDKGTYGGKVVFYKSLGMRWYDATKKTYEYESFDNDGVISHSTATQSGEKWVALGSLTDSKGKTYQTRTTTTFSASGSVIQNVGEISEDGGKTWKPYWESTNTKTKTKK